MTGRRRVLFVDDEVRVVAGLRRMLHTKRREWDMVFAGSANEALEHLAQRQFDVLVTDLQMPGIDGTELLFTAQKRFPSTVRIVLSGQTMMEGAVGSLGPAHRFLSKPCPRATLLAAIQEACAAQRTLVADRLKQLVSSLDSLPSQTRALEELTLALRESDCSVKVVGELVSRDLGTATKVLQLANSAFFGARCAVEDPPRAVAVLGLEVVNALVSAQRVFSTFGPDASRVLSLDDVWQHSIDVAGAAQRIGRLEGMGKRTLGEAFTAGLLHDVGRLILAAHLPDVAEEVTRRAASDGTPEWQVERELLGASHAEVGGYLAGLWGLPPAVVTAMTHHHTPEEADNEDSDVLTLVLVANCLSHGESPSCVDQLQGHLQRRGLLHRLSAWRGAWRPDPLEESA